MIRPSVFLAWCAAALFAFDAAAMPEESCCRPVPKWYVGLTGSLVFLNQTDIQHSVPYGYADYQTHKMGYGINGQIGRRLFPNIRAELELGYHLADVRFDPANTVTGTNAGTPQQEYYSAMINGYYDWHNTSRFTPYFGAGIGEVYVKVPRDYILNLSPLTTTSQVKGWMTGYQFMLGVNYEIPNFVTPIEISLGYRYMSGSDAHDTISGVPGRLSFNNDAQNVELGGRVFF